MRHPKEIKGLFPDHRMCKCEYKNNYDVKGDSSQASKSLMEKKKEKKQLV